MRYKMVTIDDIIRKHETSLLDLQGVTAIAQTEINGKEHILVMLEESLPEIEASIPSTLGGYPVAIEVSGKIRALSK
jgi:hypothetical protein